MSDSPEVTTNKTTPNVVKTPKAVKFSSVHVTFGKSKGIDVTRAAKLNRSYIRANFDVIAKQWPALRASQKANRDSNRYPDMIPSGLAKQIATRTVKGAKR